jgi:hypothetical protein
VPAGSEDPKLGDTRIRNLAAAVAEILKIIISAVTAAPVLDTTRTLPVSIKDSRLSDLNSTVVADKATSTQRMDGKAKLVLQDDGNETR